MKNHPNNLPIRCLMFSFVLFNSMGAHSAAARQEIHDENLTTKISRYYLRSFATTKKSVSGKSPQKGDPNWSIVQAGDVHLAPTTQRKVMLRSIFSDIPPNQVLDQPVRLNSNAWSDLILFSGASTQPQHHLLARINHTNTIAGECALATLLVTPTADVPTLVRRQQTIRFFLENPDFLADVQKVLKNYHSIEPSLLSLWTATDPLYTKEYRTYMQRRFFTKDPASNRVASKLRSRIFFRNAKDIYGEFLSLPVFGITWCGLSYLGSNVFSTQGRGINLTDVFETLPLFVPGYSIGFAVGNYSKVKKAGGKPAFLPFLGVAATNGLAVWRGYRGIKQYQEYRMIFRNLANRMKDAQIVLQTLQQVSNEVEKTPELESVYGDCFKETRALLNSSQASGEIGVMIRNLLTIKFDNWSYLRNNGATLLATYQLFETYKDCLKPAMYELGQLDALMGIASLVKKSQAARPSHCYTFTRFLDRTQQKTPSIQLNAMWNPLLHPQNVVDNEVAMDAHNTRNMILCGPNSGGKSSFLSGVATNLLLSQTFGIAAASNAVITPFDIIHTHIEVGDDIASGASLFMVEVARMQKHINALKNAKSDVFSFAIFDEPFAGTNPAEATASAYSILAHMAQYPNALHIVASHYPFLMQLEKNVPGRGIRNYKVSVRETTDQKLHYTYKIVPGQATQTVGIKILEQEGYDKSVIQQAKDVMQYPKKVYANVGQKKLPNKKAKGK
ncbi:MAG TPA: hypothetical protein VK133_00255 [Amoebophilaceae bacterium]|nr:hypothetical protein [Amoebophilaceae bacterium]